MKKRYKNKSMSSKEVDNKVIDMESTEVKEIFKTFWDNIRFTADLKNINKDKDAGKRVCDKLNGEKK